MKTIISMFFSLIFLSCGSDSSSIEEARIDNKAKVEAQLEEIVTRDDEGNPTEVEGLEISENLGDKKMSQTVLKDYYDNNGKIFKFTPPEDIVSEFSEPVVITGSSLLLFDENDTSNNTIGPESESCESNNYSEVEPGYVDLLNFTTSQGVCGLLTIQFCVRLYSTLLPGLVPSEQDYVYLRLPSLIVNLPCKENTFEDLSFRIEPSSSKDTQYKGNLLISSSPEVFEVKVSNSINCLDGDWRTISQRIDNWNLEFNSDTVFLYAKFKDIFGQESECLETSISISEFEDQQGTQAQQGSNTSENQNKTSENIDNINENEVMQINHPTVTSIQISPDSYSQLTNQNINGGCTGTRVFYCIKEGGMCSNEIGDDYTDSVACENNTFSIVTNLSMGKYNIKVIPSDGLINGIASSVSNDYYYVLRSGEFYSLPWDVPGYNDLPSSDVREMHVEGQVHYVATASGLAISNDGGQTYTTKNTFDGLASNQATEFFKEGSTLVVGSKDGVSISLDNGLTWFKKNTDDGIAHNQINDVYISESNIYVSTMGGLSASSDNGSTWSTINHGVNAWTNGIYVDGNMHIVVSQDWAARSTDDGSTWTTLNNATNGLGTNKLTGVTGVGGNIYVSGWDCPISISNDNGLNFVCKNASNGIGSNNAYFVHADENAIYVGTTGGLSISTDGGTTWVNRTTDNGLGSNTIYDITQADGNLYVSTSNGIGISEDGGMTFTTNYGTNNIGTNFGFPFVSNNKLYVSTYGSGLAISENNGATFTKLTVDDGLASNNLGGVYVDGEYIVVATDLGLSVSNDGGTSFSTRTTADGLLSNWAYSVWGNQGSIVVGTYGGGVGISSDGGQTFISKNSGDGLANDYVLAVYKDDSTIYAGTFGGLSISADNGSTWTTKSTVDGLGSNYVYDVKTSGSNIYLATYGGLSISNDNGSTWVNRTTTDGLGSNFCKSILLKGTSIYVGTDSGLSISTDGGASFVNKKISDGLANDSIGGLFGTQEKLYITNASGLSVSTQH